LIRTWLNTPKMALPTARCHCRQICQYFPKGSCFAKLTDEEVARVQDKLNSRPRKCLDYATPNDIFAAPPPIALAA
jgi:IS30 family transposase